MDQNTPLTVKEAIRAASRRLGIIVPTTFEKQAEEELAKGGVGAEGVAAMKADHEATISLMRKVAELVRSEPARIAAPAMMTVATIMAREEDVSMPQLFAAAEGTINLGALIHHIGDGRLTVEQLKAMARGEAIEVEIK